MAREAIVPPRTDDPVELQEFYRNICRFINNLIAAIPADSTAVDVAGVVADLNALQDSIRDNSV